MQTQRALSDDVLLDQSLLAMPAQAEPEPAPAAPAQSDADQAVRDDDAQEADQQAASLPGMRALIPTFHALWPAAGQITTYFGEVGPYSPRGHSGIDLAGPWGSPVVAMEVGDVLKAYWNTEGYGGLVVIAHPSGYETWYGHLARLEVEPGQHVERGEEIALMGSSGYSTGSHLHFEVRQDGNLVDPLAFLDQAALHSAR